MSWSWNEAKVVIKTARDTDLYVGWSTTVDGPVWVGDRATARSKGVAEERLARADATGTSRHNADEFGWDDPGMVVQGRWWLPREHLARYLDLICNCDADDSDPRVRELFEDAAGQPGVVTLILGTDDDGEAAGPGTP